MPVIRYITSELIDNVEGQVSNNGPLMDNEVENDFEPDQEQGRSTEDYTIPPVDATKSYRKRTAIENEEDPCRHKDDMLDFSVDMPKTSQLNLVMGVGTQTQKVMDYCNTPVQLSPGVIYGSEQQQQRQASNINKRVCRSILISLIFTYKTLMILLYQKILQNLLKRMTSNIKKYNALVQIVQEMNNLVSDAKTKCFWDQEIMQVCKQWEDTLRSTPVCVPPDSVREPQSAACDVDQEVIANEECRGDAEAQEVIANVVDSVRHIESEGKTCDFIVHMRIHIHMLFHIYMRFHVHMRFHIHMRFHVYI
ncbi:hypothetical protein HanPI659440_Chr04g0171771 [Helianthus annuus]|nr:hypothetical protein HanPI659440_Chr04g0171771 [Helianthus annuus]